MPFRGEKYQPARGVQSYASSTSKSQSEIGSVQSDISVVSTRKKKKKKWHRFISRGFGRNKRRIPQKYFLSPVSSRLETTDEVQSISTKPSSTKTNLYLSETSCEGIHLDNTPKPLTRKSTRPSQKLEIKKIYSNMGQFDISHKEMKMLKMVNSVKDEVIDVPYPKPRSVIRNNNNNLKSPLHKTEQRNQNEILALTQPTNRVNSVNIIAMPSPSNKGKQSNTPTPKPRCRPQNKVNEARNLNSSTSTNTPTQNDKPHYLVVEVVYYGRSLDGNEKSSIQKKVARLVDEMLQSQSESNNEQIKAVNKEMESASPNQIPPNQQGQLAQNYLNLLNQRNMQQPNPQYVKHQQKQQSPQQHDQHGTKLDALDIRTKPTRQHIKPKNHHLEALPVQFHPNNPVMTPISEGQQTATYLTQGDLDDTKFFHQKGFDFHLPTHSHPIIEKVHDSSKYQGQHPGETPQEPRRQLDFSGEESSLQRLMDFMNADDRSPSHTSNPRKYPRKPTSSPHHPRRQKHPPKPPSPGSSPKLKETRAPPQNVDPTKSRPKTPADRKSPRKKRTPKERTPSREKPGKPPLSLFKRKGPSPSGTSPPGTLVNVYGESDRSTANSDTQPCEKMLDHAVSDHEMNHIMRTNNHEILCPNENLISTNSGHPNSELVTPVLSSRHYRSCSRTPATPTEHDAWWMPNTWARERAIGAYGRAWKFEQDLEKERERELLLVKDANVEKIRTSNFIRF